MIKKPIAEALFFKYYKDGALISTRQNPDGSYEITKWQHPDGIKKPTEAQINTAIAEYKADLQQKQASFRTVKEAIRTKLGLTKEEFKNLAKAMREEL